MGEARAGTFVARRVVTVCACGWLLKIMEGDSCGMTSSKKNQVERAYERDWVPLVFGSIGAHAAPTTAAEPS